MSKSKRFIALYLGIGLIALFAILAILVANHVFDEFDAKLIHWIYELRGSHSNHSGAFYWINRVTTELGYMFVLVPLCVGVLIAFKGNLESLFFSVGTLVGWLANKGVKKIFMRPRPLEMYRMMTETSSSFPSGHSMSAAACYFMGAYLIYRSNLSKKLKVTLTIITAAIPVIVGITRINLSVHFLTDVLGGLILGLGFVCIAIFVFETLKEKGYNGLKALGKKNK